MVAEPLAGRGPRQRTPSATLQHGTFCFGNLPTDSYRLRVIGTSREQALAPIRVEVEAGAQHWVEIPIDPQGATARHGTLGTH